MFQIPIFFFQCFRINPYLTAGSFGLVNFMRKLLNEDIYFSFSPKKNHIKSVFSFCLTRCKWKDNPMHFDSGKLRVAGKDQDNFLKSSQNNFQFCQRSQKNSPNKWKNSPNKSIIVKSINRKMHQLQNTASGRHSFNSLEIFSCDYRFLNNKIVQDCV